ncbi:MAG: hypothetical protein FWC71_10260 [Defluviitaleaceae bacterium]|nr:hypothetical protein [Defluviitaleaceae bacterium]
MPQASALAFFENLLTLQELVGTSDAEQLAQLRNTARDKNECYTIKALATNGHDLSKVGIPHRKQMGDVLERLLDAVMHKPEKIQSETLLNIAVYMR